MTNQERAREWMVQQELWFGGRDEPRVKDLTALLDTVASEARAEALKEAARDTADFDASEHFTNYDAGYQHGASTMRQLIVKRLRKRAHGEP